MKKQLIKMALGLVLFSAVLGSCEKNNAEEGNDEEVITTMRLTFLPTGGGAAVTYQFDDADGPGGNAATQDAIVLAPQRQYAVTLQLLNKTKTPVEDITVEVANEPGAHRFYYELSAGSNIMVSGLNTDGAGIPLGINSTWTTSAAATGKVKITLRHYAGTPPAKAIADAVNSSKSSTDIEVEFNTRLQ